MGHHKRHASTIMQGVAEEPLFFCVPGKRAAGQKGKAWSVGQRKVLPQGTPLVGREPAKGVFKQIKVTSESAPPAAL